MSNITLTLTVSGPEIAKRLIDLAAAEVEPQVPVSLEKMPNLSDMSTSVLIKELEKREGVKLVHTGDKRREYQTGYKLIKLYSCHQTGRVISAPVLIFDEGYFKEE